MKKRLFLLITVIVLALTLLSCSQTPALDTEKEISVMVLNGTTGFGAAKLIDDSANGNTELNYKFSVESDASVVNSALINGSVDIAALPTNAAAVVYNKTGGNVKVAAVNTLGVLYIVENGESVNSFADLKGKTVYVPGQGSNPEYVTAFLCEENGLKVGEDVTLDFTYNAPADLRTAVASGQVEIAVLPEPMVTIAKTANADLRVALDLTKEWDKVAEKNSLMQGCIVVTKKFADENPQELNKFLEEYGQSVNFVNENPTEASEMIAEHGIFEKAQVAAKAIPNCNLCYITGEEMKTSLSKFYEVLLEADPASVGGSLPSDDIYYIG